MSTRQQTDQSVYYCDEVITRYFRRFVRHVYEYTGSFIGFSISNVNDTNPDFIRLIIHQVVSRLHDCGGLKSTTILFDDRKQIVEPFLLILPYELTVVLQMSPDPDATVITPLLLSIQRCVFFEFNHRTCAGKHNVIEVI